LADRVRNIDATNQTTARIIATRTTGEWLKIFDGSGIPHIVVNTLEGLAEDPHLVATGFWKFMDHPSEGRLRMASFPVNFAATPADIRRPAPRLGEHTAQLLREAGLDEATIAALMSSGAAMGEEQAAQSVTIGGD
jgi:crotonobetainyl-CoA:carnitine CoA-transferase CaiB-like acyl-CoA transferase